MKVRLLRDVNIPGGRHQAGQVIEPEAWVAERLVERGHAEPHHESPVPADAPAEIEHRDPEPEHRDPAPAAPRRRKQK